MKSPQPKAQTVITDQQSRTVTFNDDRYFVQFEIPCDYNQGEIKVTGVDTKLEKAVGAYLSHKDLMEWVDDVKKIGSRIPQIIEPVIPYWLPCDLGKIVLNKIDIAVLDFALNEPDDEIMVELIKKLEAV